MGSVTSLTHKGKTIVVIDLSGCQPDETLKIIAEAKPVIAKLAPKSGLVVTEVKGSKYTKEVAEAIKGLVSHNTSYLKGSAVVGAEGAALILLQTVIFISRRELKTFAKREEAFDWLVSIP
jgi:hypothetical protein